MPEDGNSNNNKQPNVVSMFKENFGDEDINPDILVDLANQAYAESQTKTCRKMTPDNLKKYLCEKYNLLSNRYYPIVCLIANGQYKPEVFEYMITMSKKVNSGEVAEQDAVPDVAKKFIKKKY